MGNGGAQKSLSFVINHMAKLDYDVCLVTYDDRTTSVSLDSRINSINLNHQFKRSILNRIKERIRTIYKIRKVLKRESPDLLCAFLSDVAFDVSIARMWINVKLISSERNDPKSNNIVRKILSYYAYAKSDLVVFQTKNAMNFFPETITNKGLVIPNVSNERVNINSEKQPTYKIVSIGSLTKNKDFETTILGFHEFNKIDRKYELHIYGDGPESDNLKNLIARIGSNDDIKLMGLVIDAKEHLKNYDLFIFSSRSEGIPNVVIEAMERGIPVITTKTIPDGTELLIEDRESGLLFEIGEFDRLALLIHELVSNQPFATYLAENAQQSLKRFSPDVIIPLLIKAFEKLL